MIAGRCISCGCTDQTPCQLLTPRGVIAGLCCWVNIEHTKCSACFDFNGKARTATPAQRATRDI